MAAVAGNPNGSSHGRGKKTGLVYDERLTAHFCEWNQAYTERPERVESCYSRIQQLGLSDRCEHIPLRSATDAEALLCHSQQHIDLLKQTRMMGVEELSKLSQSFDFVYFHNKVDENACLALGGAVDLVEKVVTGQIKNGMAIIRPPGHHAMHNEFNGYCYLNNVAVAASVATQKHGLKRVLIVDWDVHHGQGTQFQFYDDPRVMFFSIHRYEYGSEWPHLRESDYDYMGEGKGRGFNFNLPVNETGCDNSDYLAMFFNVLLPVAYEYQPELVLISAGFDAAIGCPEGEMCLSPACFAHFVNLLYPLASGKMALILEGGYCLKTLAEGAALSLRALLGDPTPNIPPIRQPKDSVVESVLNVIKVHRDMHPSLAFQDTLTLEEEENNRTWQTNYPPKSGVSLRTQQRRPEQFPLVQECYSPLSDAELAMLDRQIKQLEDETILTVAQHRVGVLFYHTSCDTANGESDSLPGELIQGDVLSRCHLLQDKPNSSIDQEVSEIMAATTQDKIQSCVMLPHHFRAPGLQSHAFLPAVVAAQKKYDVRRILFLSLFENWWFPPVPAAGQDSSTLFLSVGCGAEGANSMHNKGQPLLVDVPASRNQMNDGDLLSACHQILLPVAYEYGPDLIILSLGLPRTSQKGVSGPSVSCVGHVIALMQGLARGHMLLLAKPETKEDMDCVSECVSVMLGDPCKMLDPCIPQPRTVDVIKKVQDQQRSVWRTLQFRGTSASFGCCCIRRHADEHSEHTHACTLTQMFALTGMCAGL